MGLATQLQRLTRIFEERGGPMLPVLRAVEAAQEPRYYVEVSALSRRMTILLPARPDVLAPLASKLSLGELPSRPLLKVFIDGDQLHFAVMSVGSVPASEGVTVAPPRARTAWLDVVSAMHAFGSGAISSRLRFLDQQRATLDVLYAARAPEDDAAFAASLDQIAWRLGVAPAQRELAKSHHSALQGAAVVVTGVCTDGGPAPELAFMYGNTDWDEAVRLCQLVASQDAARGGAAMLGTLAATLEAETTSGVQLVLGPDGPDVNVLVTLK